MREIRERSRQGRGAYLAGVTCAESHGNGNGTTPNYERPDRDPQLGKSLKGAAEKSLKRTEILSRGDPLLWGPLNFFK